ncbi:MAG TPA: DinB family protein [Longimicrobiaceae bacterium]|nr:DinB family protein [Longimicrobiaceae bacterium]
MTEPTIAPPAADEHAPFYAGYIAGVSGTDVLGLLRRQPAALRAACAGLRDDEARHRYAPGKWSVKEALGHVCDTERVMAYRLLRFSRGDATPVPGFEQDSYVRAAGFDDRTVEELLRSSMRCAPQRSLWCGTSPPSSSRDGAWPAVRR